MASSGASSPIPAVRRGRGPGSRAGRRFKNAGGAGAPSAKPTRSGRAARNLTVSARAAEGAAKAIAAARAAAAPAGVRSRPSKWTGGGIGSLPMHLGSLVPMHAGGGMPWYTKGAPSPGAPCRYMIKHSASTKAGANWSA